MPQAALELYLFSNRKCEVKKGLIFSEIIATLLDIRECTGTSLSVFQIVVPFDSVKMILKLSLQKTPHTSNLNLALPF